MHIVYVLLHYRSKSVGTIRYKNDRVDFVFVWQRKVFVICIVLSSTSAYLNIVKNPNEFMKHFNFCLILFKI